MGSVFDSQVLALLSSIKEGGFFKDIFLFLGLKDELQKQDFYKRNNRPDIEVIFYKTYPNYPAFNYLNRKSIKSALRYSPVKLSDVIFHVRGEVTAWHLKKVLDLKSARRILTDIRGASIEEIEEFSGLNRILRNLKINNYRNALKHLSEPDSEIQNNQNNHPRISVVSDSLAKYLKEKFHINRESIVITPCLAGQAFNYSETERVKIREEFKVNNADILIVFSSGGTAVWQNNDVLIMLAERGIKVLNLSKKEITHRNIINKFVSYDKMPSYLNAADAAIIWREESVVNKVASPVKFSEYICCGLPVISNSAVDMIKEYILNEDCGLILNSLDELDMTKLTALKRKNRISISEKGIQNFGVESITKKYLETYSLLTGV